MGAPEQSSQEVAANVDDSLPAERGFQAGIDEDSIAAKQRLLNAEIHKVHALVGGRRSSFLEGLVRKADYEVNLHEPAESSADIDAAVNNILKTETGKMGSSSKTFSADKARLLQQELAKISSIAGRRSFLEPFVPPIAVQEAQQMSLPSVININYQVPK